MELTIFLSQLFGIYALVGGFAILARRRYFLPIVGGFAEERLTRLVVAILELLGGLALVLSHNVWGTLPEIIISLFGWGLVLEGAFYMLASDDAVEALIKQVNVPAWYWVGGVISLVVGAYLAAFGFGWL